MKRNKPKPPLCKPPLCTNTEAVLFSTFFFFFRPLSRRDERQSSGPGLKSGLNPAPLNLWLLWCYTAVIQEGGTWREIITSAWKFPLSVLWGLCQSFVMDLTKAYSPSLHGTSHCCFSVSARVVCMKETSTSASQSRILRWAGVGSGRKGSHRSASIQETPASTRPRGWEQRAGKVLFAAGNQALSSNFLFHLRLSSPNANRHSCPLKPALCQAVSRQAMTRRGTGREPSSCHYY